MSSRTSRPRVQLQDSPLALAGSPTEPATKPAPARVAKAKPAAQPKAAAGATNRAKTAAESTASTTRAAGARPAPAVDEHLVRLAVDVPESILRAFEDATHRLRTGGARRLSQKQLPARDVLSAVLWSSLPASDAQFAELEQTVRSYQAARHDA